MAHTQLQAVQSRINVIRTMRVLWCTAYLMLWQARGLASHSDMVKDVLLRALELPSTPTPDNPSLASSSYMMALYEAFHSTAITNKVTARPAVAGTWENGGVSMSFLLEANEKHPPAKAELILKIYGKYIILQEMTANVCSNGSCHTLTPVLRELKFASDAWLVYDVTDCIKVQCQDGAAEQTIVFNIYYPNMVGKACPFLLLQPDTPLLVLYSNPVSTKVFRQFGKKKPSSVRRKRSTDPVVEDYSKPCSLHSWYVSFEELQWHTWILRPEGYEANFCAGVCPEPLTNIVSTSNHAYVKSVSRLMQQDSAHYLPPACCVPIRLKPLPLLYKANSSYILRSMGELTAKGCGCL